MRKLRFLQTGASHKAQNPFKSFYEGLGRLAIALCFSAAAFPVFAQCLTESGKIGGRVFNDRNYNGNMDSGEPGVAFVSINAFNGEGLLVASALTDFNGGFSLSGLADHAMYSIEINKPSYYEYSKMGLDQIGDTRTMRAPSCSANFGLFKPVETLMEENPKLAVANFVGGASLDINGTERTILELDESFNSISPINKLVTKSQTGAVWGLAWNRTQKLLYASAFVKQGAVLGPLGTGGIYVFNKQAAAVTNFINLSDVGIQTGSTQGLAVSDCKYGDLVGKVGIGNIDISDDDQFLFVSNLHNKSVVIIPTKNPNESNVIEIKIPDPGCNGGDYAVSALKYYNGLLYIGVTCTAETSQKESDCVFHVYELNLLTRVYNLILSTDFAKNYWPKQQRDLKNISQWLTDLDFTINGEMILGITDRKGHAYCVNVEPLTNQTGDILMAFKTDKGWQLESGGVVNGRLGTGAGHYEGPGGGEFFGEDYWIVGPGLHQETALGGLTSVAKKNEVIAAVFDPIFESFAGGLHRYSTINGKKLGAIQIYNPANSVFGKASGIGDIEVMNQAIPLEIGNLIWLDQNENGVQDAEEKGISGVQVSLYDNNCTKVASVISGTNGEYLFNNTNVDVNKDGAPDGLEYDADYFIVIDDPRYNTNYNTIILGNDTLSVTIADQITGGIPDQRDNDARILPIYQCSIFKGLPAVKIHTGNNGQNKFNLDIGLRYATDSSTAPPEEDVIDLALIKKVKTLGSLRKNDFVEFAIEVHNQGTIPVASFEIVDYIPSELGFVSEENLDWNITGSIAHLNSKSAILPGGIEIFNIRLKVLNDVSMSDIINQAEIAAMYDDKGQPMKDHDSSPDQILGNDRGGIPNSLTDNTLDNPDDEDDHDAEALFVNDLALIKTTASTAPVKRGDLVTFNITVKNQGNTNIAAYEITDYIPTGFEFVTASNPLWTLTPAGAVYGNSSGISTGSTQTVNIVLKIKENATAETLINTAEISSMTNSAGVEIMDRDSKADNNSTNDAGGVIGSVTDNAFDGDGTVDEDDHDRETVFIADLALIKQTTNINPVKVGDLVPFQLTIFNQGSIAISNYTISDYLPSGLEFIANENPGWLNVNGIATFHDIQTLEPGKSRTLTIKLKVKSSDYRQLVNVAEISALKDANNADIKDWDSTPDNNPGNDAGGLLGSATDNLISGDGQLDEDDQDPAGLQIFDLALILTTTKTTPVKIGEDVLFQIRICNQGNITAKNVSFTDYIPAGLALSPLDNNGWMLKGGKFYNSILSNIEPGQCATKEIKLRVKENAQVLNLLNRAEIVSAENTSGIDMSGLDTDSQPDEIEGNDAGGIFGSVTDNKLDGNGIDDEDDADPEALNILDIALRKTLVEGSVLKYKGVVNFKIELFNQGNITVKNIGIADYIPFGFELSAASVAAGWVMNNGVAEYLSNSVLQPGGTASVFIELKDLGTSNILDVRNFAEVLSVQNVAGDNFSAYDFDSTPDGNSGNDVGAELGTLTDDMISDHGVQDEDDHDVATVPVFDLALRKTLENKQLIYHSGDTVNFRIEVLNQGNVVASTSEIVDYLDTSFIFSLAINPGWEIKADNKIYFNVNQAIGVGESFKTNVKLIIKAKKNGLTIFNCGEISKAKDAAGNLLIDYDSTPDDIQNNDKSTPNHDVSDHGENDEDDHDIANTNPNNFDLALRKEIAVRTVVRGQIVPWTITITNEGTVTASEIILFDYLPSGTLMISKDWYQNPQNPDPRKYYYLMNIKNGRLPAEGLKPGESIQVIVETQVDPTRPSGQVVNRAEIYSASNEFGEPDEDSTPDDVVDNDEGGQVFEDSDQSGSAGPEDPSGQDEDDSDVAGAILLEIVNSACECLNNASNPDDGQFSTTLTLESRTGEIWFIRSVNGLYHTSSPAPPALPVPFTTGPMGFLLSPVISNGAMTVYEMSGIHVDGVGFDIVLENQFGDKVSLGNVRCNYNESTLIEAQNNVCTGSNVRYSVDYHPGSTYQWILSSGGSFTSQTNTYAANITWNGAVGTKHFLTVIERNPDLCLKPIRFEVTIGDQIGSVSCIGAAQISLGVDCEALVTPQMLLLGGPYDYNSYAVMIMNKDGSLVPNATLTYEHLGKTLMAKVLNVCNGNSCWATLTVEDKIKPRIVCLNDTIDCTRMQSYLGPLVYDYCDPAPQKILIDERIEDTRCNQAYSKIVTRNYVAKDASGNVSDTCTQQIFLKRINLDEIVFPDSLSLATNNPLLCGTFGLDSLGRPHTSYTGVPMYHGAPIWPNKDNKYCDFGASYEDFVIPTGKSCTQKILRNWRFIIWYCTTFEQRVYNQLIEITDTTAPVIMCPYDITASTNSYECFGNVWIPDPVVFDSCSSQVTLDLVSPVGIIKNFTSRTLRLPAGNNVLTFRAYDNCHNESTCSFNVYVKDQAAPVVQCDKETVVTLDRFGQAWIPAHVFDDGSYDDCHIASMQARRMDNGVPCQYNPNVYADSVGFCCADIGNLVQVMFKVTDAEGNSNTCMILVEVQDKTIPQISCPHDVTIDCDYHYNPNDLSEFGQPRVSDNCDVTVREVDSFYVNQCREGYIDRIFIAGNGFGQNVCVQRITIINNNPFTEKSIRWPRDFDTTSCASDILDPKNLPLGFGYPIITEDKCDLVGVNYEDHVFRIVNGNDACYKVLRKWKVINWCRFYNPTGAPIIYEKEQIIKVYNTVKPNFLSGCVDRRFEINDTSCFGRMVDLVATGYDDCTPPNQLRNEFHVDLNSDGIEDRSGLGVGNIVDASGFYPLGKHRVKYVLEDLCGNKEVCEINFEIINVKTPTAYCLKGLAAGLVAMDLNGDGRIDGELVTIWAKDFDQGSNHPCGYPLTYSIGRDTTIKSVTYNCDSLGRREVLFCVTASNGQQSCCETFIDIQDNNNVDYCNCFKQPSDITVSNCAQLTEPGDLNSYPTIGSCRCTDADITHSDVKVSGGKNECFVIERTWFLKFTCPGNNNDFSFVQRIVVTTDLKESDITWPNQTVIVDNCLGSIDTAYIGEVPTVCGYKGQVMLMFNDRLISKSADTSIYERTWTAFSKCVTDGSQTFTFVQTLIVVNSTGVKYTVPADVTVTDCKKSILPDSLNGYPKTNCPCSFVQHSYVDSIGFGTQNACYVIYRKWTSTYNCPPDVVGTFRGTQKIIVSIDLKLTDIKWPADSFVVDNCSGNIDTGRVNHVPMLLKDFCGYVTISYVDTIKLNNDTCRIVQRTWRVNNVCKTGAQAQVYKFDQKIKILYPDGPKLIVPNDITITDCKKSTLPDSLNGYPKSNCPCTMVTHSYKDSIGFGTPNTCYVIYRKWTSVFNCPPDLVGTLMGTQRIAVSIDLKLTDIMWPADSFVVDNCTGDIDTSVVNHVPTLKKDFCGYVSITYVDSVKSNNDTCKIVQRKWTVSNTCKTGAQAQSFNFNQVIKVLFPTGPKLVLPPDLTVTDCAKPFLPDSLNGYPTVKCGCDSLTFKYTDDTIRTNPEVCYVVNRNWEVRIRCRPEVDTTIFGVQKITRDVNLNPADITWPRDSFTSFTCTPTTNPDIVGRPSLKKNYCGLVKFNFVDTVLAGNPCRTVKRTWRATNDCSVSQVFSFNQYIITLNQTPPSITCPADRTVNADPNTCGAVVNLGNPTVNTACNTGVTFQNNAPAIFPVGKTNVIFTATDSCGNSATCITMVTVIETVPPTINCPRDTVVGCDVNTDNLGQFGTATASDNCPGVSVKDTAIRNQNVCGIGTITRIFTATDASGNTRSCTQIVTVNNPDPLDSLEINWPVSPVTVDECQSISPDSLGKPTVNAGSASCFKLRITSQDSNFCKTRGSCEIEREWTVFDSCSGNTFKFIQLIIRDDQNAPTIQGIADITVYASDTSCNNFVTMIASVSDCDSASVVITNDSPYGANDFEDASGFYPVGVTNVTFSAEDACCNIATKTVKITVVDTIAPEVTCKKVIHTIQDNGCADFNANEFIFNISDNCSNATNIMASFDRNNFMDTVVTICCDSLVNRDYLGAYTIYFKDEAGNIDSCVTLLQAIDLDSICPPNFNGANVAGIVSSRKDVKLKGIDVYLNGGKAGLVTTGNAGLYAFNNMKMGGSYETKPIYDLDHLNGVSTYDIIQIQKHILGSKPFDEPFKWIAADVNKSGSVTAADLTEIRKLILGINQRFRNNNSWRFIYLDYVWEDRDNPLQEAFPESYVIPTLNKNYLVNFVGIKVGDVDDSNKMNGALNTSSRTQEKAQLRTADIFMEKGKEYAIELKLSDWEKLEGAQAGIYIDPQLAWIKEISTNQEGSLRPEHVADVFKEQGSVRFAWNQEKGNEWKLILNIRSHKDQYLSDVMFLDKQLMNAEAYKKSGEVNELELKLDGSINTQGKIHLFQNIPNPFNQSTMIPFEINQDSEVLFEVTDLSGKLVYSKRAYYQRGYHQIELNRDVLKFGGVYYYHIQTGREKLYRRMLMID
ncbi:MAG: DUF11 domain-containing protein [Saprospiraceae bacterium]|nr:DUF11 domain-containing protein [Candidatus Vicinibacter proximus]